MVTGMMVKINAQLVAIAMEGVLQLERYISSVYNLIIFIWCSMYMELQANLDTPVLRLVKSIGYR